jgi:hypothetical protein
MKNLFAKFLPKKEAIFNQEAIIKDMPKAVSKALYPKEVMEIHHEFETAADKLLLEATSIIAEAATKDTTKVNRLEALGFKQAGQVTELKPLLQKAELSKEQVELVNYYKRNYPFNKFITEEQVKSICYKYNLVCGDVDRFKGFVSEKNLREIEKFKLKEAEIPFVTVEAVGYENKGLCFNLSKDDFTEYGLKYCFGNDFYIVGNNGENIYGSNSLLTQKCIKRFSSYRLLRVNIVETKRLLQICAPVKDMDVSGLELIEGYKLEKKHIPDPIVLQPVNGGYLILTAWGDEASDPLVVNEINN